jgi:hypothetical protein
LKKRPLKWNLFLNGHITQRTNFCSVLFRNAHLRRLPNPKLEVDSQLYFEKRERLQIYERIILQAVGFDLSIKHPASFALSHVKSMVKSKVIPEGQLPPSPRPPPRPRHHHRPFHFIKCSLTLFSDGKARGPPWLELD